MGSWLDEEIPKVDLPDGEDGNWRLEKFTISKNEASRYNFGLMFNGQGARGVDPGTYTRLVCKGRGLVMSDTPAERRDHLPLVDKAKDLEAKKVLVMGLGIGMVAGALLRKGFPVEEVTFLERERSVIKLTWPQLKARYGGRVRLIKADALEYKPAKGERYDVIWHDIWDNICLDNAKEMTKLKRRWARRCLWQGAWGDPEVQRMKRESLRGHGW